MIKKYRHKARILSVDLDIENNFTFEKEIEFSSFVEFKFLTEKTIKELIIEELLDTIEVDSPDWKEFYIADIEWEMISQDEFR